MLGALLVAAAMGPMPSDTQRIVEAAQADAKRRFGVEAELVDVQRVTWPDGSLGCPRKGMRYPQVLVPGWRITLRAGERSFDYHASSAGGLVHCPPGQGQAPLPDSQT